MPGRCVRCAGEAGCWVGLSFFLDCACPPQACTCTVCRRIGAKVELHFGACESLQTSFFFSSSFFRLVAFIHCFGSVPAPAPAPALARPSPHALCSPWRYCSSTLLCGHRPSRAPTRRPLLCSPTLSWGQRDSAAKLVSSFAGHGWGRDAQRCSLGAPCSNTAAGMRTKRNTEIGKTSGMAVPVLVVRTLFLNFA